jgi:hypothetical protein
VDLPGQLEERTGVVDLRSRLADLGLPTGSSNSLHVPTER